MSSDPPEYRLAAIISGDIAGYSRLIGSDEAAAVRLVTAYREEIEELVPRHQGTLVDFTGDNFLAHFSSSVAAVLCAVEIQHVLANRNESLPEHRRMQFRIGVHQGDVRMEGGRVFGTGVNVAARLEALADPGGICISGSVRDQLRGRVEFVTESMGTRTVKNIDDPVPVHRLLFDGAPAPAEIDRRDPGFRRKILLALVLGASALAIIAGFFGLRERNATGPSMVEDPIGSPLLDDGPSLVVMPFLNLSDDVEQDFFADGLAEDLTTDLSKVPALFVISRSSAFTYKGREVDARAVGSELGVRYLIEGSVRKVDDRVRITAQLIDTTTGYHVWSERYDREFADVFEIQQEINAEILSALPITIAEAELARIRRKPIENLSAYEAWHKGRMLIRELTRDGILEGRRLLERAIELEPGYGEAHAELANSYFAEFQTWNMDFGLVDMAARHAERGVELSPLSPISLTSLALVELVRFNVDEALRLGRRVIEIAPSHFSGYSIIGGALVLMERREEAIPYLEKAVRLNPLAPDVAYTTLGAALFFTDRKDESIALFERVRAANPEALVDRLTLIAHYQETGDPERARRIVAEVLALNPDYTTEQAIESFRWSGPAVPAEEWEILRAYFEAAGLP